MYFTQQMNHQAKKQKTTTCKSKNVNGNNDYVLELAIHNISRMEKNCKENN